MTMSGSLSPVTGQFLAAAMRNRADPYLLRGLIAGRPDRARQRGAVRIGGNVDEPEARSLGLR